mmetsp:Transcript_9128/g.21703  ORF Transcript_9128/g.21703 Transcript_9128/m.21703 type:complete len:461 (-) Transcript_9128:85-1467(-)
MADSRQIYQQSIFSAVLLLAISSSASGFQHQRGVVIGHGRVLGSTLSSQPLVLQGGRHGNKIDHAALLAPRRNPNTSTALGATPTAAFTAISAAFQSSAVQKILELATITGIGYTLRSKLDPKGITALLLNALVPSIIVSSLSGLSVSAESLGCVVASGVALAIAQLIGSELSSRFVIPRNQGGDEFETDILRRTASVQLSSMAPGLSVLSFTKEFASLTLAGLSTLADVPSKVYSLVLLPYYLRFRGIFNHEDNTDGGVANEVIQADKPSFLQKIGKAVKDPFNLAISSGLILAALGRPVHTLGFVGNAIGSLAKSQTAVLFLLIGLKLKFSGDRPKLCLRLLLARHGFMSLFASVFLAICLPLKKGASDATRLAAVLSSHAASSIIAYGQMNKAITNENVQGYDVDLAFDIVALSYQMTMVLNTIACLAGPVYVNNLPVAGTTMLALSAVIGKIGGKK